MKDLTSGREFWVNLRDYDVSKIEVEDEGDVILADTVGFIRQLPHDLVAAFKATLQETQEAVLLLHVIDASDERFRDNIDAVNTVLEEIEAHEVPTLLVMNKNLSVKQFGIRKKKQKLF